MNFDGPMFLGLGRNNVQDIVTFMYSNFFYDNWLSRDDQGGTLDRLNGNCEYLCRIFMEIYTGNDAVIVFSTKNTLGLVVADVDDTFRNHCVVLTGLYLVELSSNCSLIIPREDGLTITDCYSRIQRLELVGNKLALYSGDRVVMIAFPATPYQGFDEVFDTNVFNDDPKCVSIRHPEGPRKVCISLSFLQDSFEFTIFTTSWKMKKGAKKFSNITEPTVQCPFDEKPVLLTKISNLILHVHEIEYLIFSVNAYFLRTEIRERTI